MNIKEYMDKINSVFEKEMVGVDKNIQFEKRVAFQNSLSIFREIVMTINKLCTASSKSYEEICILYKSDYEIRYFVSKNSGYINSDFKGMFFDCERLKTLLKGIGYTTDSSQGTLLIRGHKLVSKKESKR